MAEDNKAPNEEVNASMDATTTNTATTTTTTTRTDVVAGEQDTARFWQQLFDDESDRDNITLTVDNNEGPATTAASSEDQADAVGMAAWSMSATASSSSRDRGVSQTWSAASSPRQQQQQPVLRQAATGHTQSHDNTLTLPDTVGMTARSMPATTSSSSRDRGVSRTQSAASSSRQQQRQPVLRQAASGRTQSHGNILTLPPMARATSAPLSNHSQRDIKHQQQVQQQTPKDAATTTGPAASTPAASSSPSSLPACEKSSQRIQQGIRESLSQLHSTHAQLEEEGRRDHPCDQSNNTQDARVLLRHTPGAYSVRGMEATRRDVTTPAAATAASPTTTPTTSSPTVPSSPPGTTTGWTTDSSQGQQERTLGRRRPSDREMLAVAAVVVPDDYLEHESFTQRQLELQEQEARLTEQAAKLQKWQEELEGQRHEIMRLQQQASLPAAGVLQAAHVISSGTPPPPQQRAASAGGMALQHGSNHGNSRSWFNRGRRRRMSMDLVGSPTSAASGGDGGSSAAGGGGIRSARSLSRPKRRMSLSTASVDGMDDSVDHYYRPDFVELNNASVPSLLFGSVAAASNASLLPTAEILTAACATTSTSSRLHASHQSSFATLSTGSNASLCVAPQAPGERHYQQPQEQQDSSRRDEGPMRFAPLRTEPTLDERFFALTSNDKRTFRNLKQRWEDRQDKFVSKHGFDSNKVMAELPLEWHLRFLYANQKHHKRDNSYSFSEERAWSALKKLNKRYAVLNVYQMRLQLESKTLFPVPGLRTKAGHDMFYMRPSRYFPNRTSVKTIINNLCYVMNTMHEKNSFAQQEGIGFIACMDDWHMKNFDVKYCYQFMMALQGFMVPVKTQLFLIVNPPSWFGAIWKIMKPMLAPSFRKRVKICPESKMDKYLAADFRMHLPDDMATGMADTDAMVADFLQYRTSVEKDIFQYAKSGVAYSDGDAASSQQQSDRMSHQESSLDFDEVRSLCSHSSGGSGLLSCHYEDDDGDASIHCDIDDEAMLENEDMKQAALSVVELSNLRPNPALNN